MHTEKTMSHIFKRHPHTSRQARAIRRDICGREGPRMETREERTVFVLTKDCTVL